MQLLYRYIPLPLGYGLKYKPPLTIFLRRCWSKMALSYYFGQWLIQQLVLPYKPWLENVI